MPIINLVITVNGLWGEGCTVGPRPRKYIEDTVMTNTNSYVRLKGVKVVRLE